MTEDPLVSKTREIIDSAADEGITLRVMGSIGFRMLCDESLLVDSFDRQIGDIDLIGYKNDSDRIHKLLVEEFDYTVDKEILMGSWNERLVFYGTTDGNRHEIDVFFDKFSMCHELNLKDRLETGPNAYALNPSDLFLEKIQIVEINEKDLQDLVSLFTRFQVSDSDDDINAQYISHVLSRDWGYYFTTLQNLDKVRQYVENSSLDEDSARTVTERIETLTEAIEATSKSIRWKFRSRIGTRMQWYNSVEEKHR